MFHVKTQRVAAMFDLHSGCQSSEQLQPIRASQWMFHVKTQRVAAMFDLHSGCQSSEQLQPIRASPFINIPCENPKSGCHVWPKFRLSVIWAANQSITIDIPCENSESGCHVWPTFRLSVIWAPWTNQSVTVGNLYENPTSGCHVWPTGPKARELKPGGFFLTKPYDLYALIWWQEILVVIKRGKLPLFQTGRKTPITYFHFNAGIRLTSLCLLLVNAVPCGGQIESLWGL